MARRPSINNTLDLFKDYKPEPIVERFESDAVQAYNMAGRLSKAVALTLNSADLSRAEIVEGMNEFLSDKISQSTLDAYASQAKEGHTISALRLVALLHVTEDARALNVLLEDVGLIAVPKKYEALLRREKARELRERAEREEHAADAEWKAKR